MYASLLQPEHHVALALALIRLSTLWISNWTRRRKKQDFNRNRKACMQRQHHNKQRLARLRFRRREDWVEIAQQKECRKRQTQRHKYVVEDYTNQSC
jgi:hypothetical protein